MRPVAITSARPLRVARGLDHGFHLLRKAMDCRMGLGNDAAPMWGVMP